MSRPVIFSLLAALVLAGAAHAQTGIRLLVSPPPAPAFTFGDTISFEVSARSQATISDVTLFVRTGHRSSASEMEADFIPGTDVKAIVSLNLALNPWPPFAAVEYWWVFRDSAGAILTTDARYFDYEDNRFTWRTARRGSLTVHWYQGDKDFGQTALDAAMTALTSANRYIGAPLPSHVDIYIYADSGQAQAALKQVGRVWADGYADPTQGVVIVAVAPDASAELNLEREIRHELTHVLVFQATGAFYAQVPAWLNEGLAVMNEAHPDPNFPAVLAKAVEAGKVIGLDQLCGPFPDDPFQAQLAYAQSESVVRFVRDRYGLEGVLSLLGAYAQGDNCEGGVARGLGLSLAEMESQWLSELVVPYPVLPRLRALGPWLALSMLILIAPGIFLLLTFRVRAAPRQG